MSRKSDLSKQILLFMLSLTLCIILISVLGSYVFYTVIYSFPGYASSANEDAVTIVDWIWIIFASLISLAIAVFFAIRLSARILSPLNSVAISLQQITLGDLSARALSKKSHLQEINSLMSDFNLMAEKLQVMDVDRKSWNAAIAHELRTPVTILRGRLQGLVDGVFEPEPRLFKNLLTQTEGLTRLIDDLRVVGSMDANAFSLQIEQDSFDDIIEKSLENFDDKFKKADLSIRFSKKELIVRCDSIRILQCLNIILDNITKYSSPGLIIIDYSMDEKFYNISITDSGPGIDPQFQPFMFEPFQRGRTGRLVNPHGCGLGLSVVRAIMQAHKGDVFYSMSSTCYSTFTLQWPIRKS